jgi:hypothetical protein
VQVPSVPSWYPQQRELPHDELPHLAPVARGLRLRDEVGEQHALSRDALGQVALVGLRQPRSRDLPPGNERGAQVPTKLLPLEERKIGL